MIFLLIDLDHYSEGFFFGTFRVDWFALAGLGRWLKERLGLKLLRVEVDAAAARGVSELLVDKLFDKVHYGGYILSDAQYDRRL